MDQETLGNVPGTLSAKDIEGGDLTTQPVDPTTGLTEGSKMLKAGTLSAKDLDESLGYDRSSFVFPGSARIPEKVLGEGQFHPEFGPEYNQQLLHERQPVTQMMGNSIARFLTEVASTAVQTLAYDSDLTLGTDLAEVTQKDFGNGLSRWAESFRDTAATEMPIYADPYKIGKFDPASASWWFENFVSSGSSLGMMLPAALLGAATGGLAGMAGFEKLAASSVFRGVSTALWSRHAENLMEGSGVWKEAYQNALAKGMKDYDARVVASNAAANTYQKQWVLLLQDIPQYILLNRLGASMKGGAAAEAEAFKDMSPKVLKYIGYATPLTTKLKKTGAVAWDMATEGGEELAQFIINEQSNLMAAKAISPDRDVDHSFSKIIKDNYDNGDMWTAGFWGAIGAGMMQAGGHAINYKMQEAAKNAQFGVVTSIGPLIKQAATEYDEALKSGDPIKISEAETAFIAAVGLKAKITNTKEAVKKMLTSLRDAKEGEGFEQWGVDSTTQGRLKETSYFDNVMKGLDEISDNYDQFIKDNKRNPKIKKENVESSAQLMAHSLYMINATERNQSKVKAAIADAWSKIENIQKLSLPGQNIKAFESNKREAEKLLKYFQERQEKIKDDPNKKEEKAILDLRVFQTENKIRDFENKIKAEVELRSPEQEKNDSDIVLLDKDLDNYDLQTGRLQSNEASVETLKERLRQLRNGVPYDTVLLEEYKKKIKDETPERDSIDADETFELDDYVEYEDPETKTAQLARIVSMQAGDENTEDFTGDTVTLQPVDETGKPIKNAELVVKQVSQLVRSVKFNVATADEIYESLSRTEEDIISRGRTSDEITPEKEGEEKGTRMTLNATNKLSYGDQNEVTKEFVLNKEGNEEFRTTISDKNTTMAGARAFYTINLNNTYVQKILTTLLTNNGVYVPEKNTRESKVVATKRQLPIIAKLLKGKELTEKEIAILVFDNTDSKATHVYTSVADTLPIAVTIKLAGKSYSGGMYVHNSNIVSTPPVSEQRKGDTEEVRDNNVTKWKNNRRIKNREVRQALLSLLLKPNTVVWTEGVNRARGVPRHVSKLLKEEQRNRLVEKAIGIKPKDAQLVIATSNKAEPELTTFYSRRGVSIPGTLKSKAGPGNTYIKLDGSETLNGEPIFDKLNKSRISLRHAELIFDAFFLVSRYKAHTKRKGDESRHSYAVDFATNKEKLGHQSDVEKYGMEISGITAGEFLDLFITHGKEFTEPNDPRFKQRYKDTAYARLMAQKRLYLQVEGDKRILVYGTNEATGKPYTIDMNERFDDPTKTEVIKQKQHFVDWVNTNKRYAIHLYHKSLGLDLDGDFLRGRQFTIKTKLPGQDVVTWTRKRGETYSSFVLRNGLLVTDMERSTDGNLMENPLVDLNLTNGKGELNVKVKEGKETLSKAEIKRRTTHFTIKEVKTEPTVENKDLKNKKDAEFSQTKEEKVAEKPVTKKKESAYYNPFFGKSKRSAYNSETGEEITEETPFTYENEQYNSPEEIIKVLSDLIEKSILGKYGLDKTIATTNRWLNIRGIVFSKSSTANGNIIKYIRDRFDKKTNRSLAQEWVAGGKPGDKTSSTTPEDVLNDDSQITDPEQKPVDVPLTDNAAEVALREVVIPKEILKEIGVKYTELPIDVQKLLNDTHPTLDDLKTVVGNLQFDLSSELPEGAVRNRIARSYIALNNLLAKLEGNLTENNKGKKPRKPIEQMKKDANQGINISREYVEKPYVPYTQERLEKEMQWAFDELGIEKEQWDVRKRFTDLIYKGKQNFALYSHSAILLYEAAEVGTIYHEAFHRVSLGYLTKGERLRFYRAARQAYNLSKEVSNTEVEQLLAEKLREYVLSEETKKAPTSIQKFFDWIIEGIKSIFYGKRRLSELEITKLFKQINTGEFRHRKILAENENILADDLIARTVLRGTTFNELYGRTDFTSITNALGLRLLKLNKVNDLMDASQIEYQPLIDSILEDIENWDDNANYEENSLQDREYSAHIRDMYKELLGTLDPITNRYDVFARVVKPSIDSWLLDIGIKSVHVSYEDLEHAEDDIELIASRGGDYNREAYEYNKRDTALPNVKFLVKTLHKNSYIDAEGNRQYPENPTTGLIDPVDDKLIWSKLQNSIYDLSTIEDMIDELRYIGENEDFSPFFELADRLEATSENTRIQFYTTLRSAKYDLIEVSYRKVAGNNFLFNVARSAFQNAYKNNVRNWNDEFFADENIVKTVEKKLKSKKKAADESYYVKEFSKTFFVRVQKDFNDLVFDIAETLKSGISNVPAEELESYKARKLAEYMYKTHMLLNDFHINIDDNVLKRLIDKMQGEGEVNDLLNLFTYLDTHLKVLFVDSPMGKVAESDPKNPVRVDRAIHSFWKIGVVYGISRADIELHPEKQNDMQLGPGNGDLKKDHRLNTFANPCAATEIADSIKNRDGYIEDRLKNEYTAGSRVLERMVPKDNTNEEDVKAAWAARRGFSLKTFSLLREQSSPDTGRGYLNITPAEDYLVRMALMRHVNEDGVEDPLLPFPIMANRKMYFLMSGVPVFKNIMQSYDDKKENFTFSEEVLDYFYNAYLSENKRALTARKLINTFETATPEEKENIKNELVLNYHYTGDFSTTDLKRLPNAINLIKFRGFPVTETPNKAEIQKKITVMLNARLKQDLKDAERLRIISYSNEEKSYFPNLLNGYWVKDYAEREIEGDEEGNTITDINYGVRALMGEYTINYIMSVLESEKIFIGDPAFFEQNKNSGEVVEDLYKRWFGVGSSGSVFAETVSDDQVPYYKTITLRRQTFSSTYYPALLEKHTELWKAHIKENNKDKLTVVQIEKEAKRLARQSLDGFLKVDATDGQALISPSMYKKMLKRSGMWRGKIQYAFELLESDAKLSPEEELDLSTIALNPLKTVYMGIHSERGLDKIVYDKMSMAILFRRMVKGSDMEKLLDRMELTGDYANLEQGEKIDVVNFSTAVKVGDGRGYELYKDPETRLELNDLSVLNTNLRYWRNLRNQLVTEAHDILDKSTVGTQVFKIGTANVVQNKPYGNTERGYWGTGRELLNDLTSSRTAVSNIGKYKIEAQLGIQSGLISNRSLMRMLQKDAIMAKKSEDFRSALKLDKDGRQYLELDAFNDRKWVYSRLMKLVTKNTVDLNLPGAQLIQVTDYGFNNRKYNKDLKFIEYGKGENRSIEMECKVSVRIFKRLIKGYDHMTHEERLASLPDKIILMGYRIPTQGQNSVVNMVITKENMLTHEAGEIIHLPLEFTTLTGSDFDIDKLYVMMHNYERINNKLQKVTFSSSKEGLNDRYDKKLRELYKIYRGDHTTFSERDKTILGGLEKLVRNEDTIKLADNLRIERHNLMTEVEALTKKLETELDDYTRRNLEDQLAIAESVVEEYDDENFLHELDETVWSGIKKKVAGVLMKAGKIGTVEEFSKLSIEDQNTSSANENRILDILQTIIADEKHFTSTTLPNSTLTGELKERASRYNRIRKGKGIRKLEAFESDTPGYQSGIKQRFQNSTKGIGPFSLQNANHSLTQMANLTMKTHFAYGVNNANGTISLHETIGSDLRYITDWLSTMIDAHVDAVKDDYIADLNVNPATYSATAIMLRLGFGISTFDFMSQPAIVDFAEEYFSVGGGRHIIAEESDEDGSSIKKAYTRVKRRLFKNLGRPYETDEDLDIDLTEAGLLLPFGEIIENEKQLIADMDPDLVKNYQRNVRQLSVLEHFMSILADGNTLNKLVLACRVDNKAFGATPTEFRFFLNRIKELEESGAFPGLSRLISSDGNQVKDGSFLTPLLKNSVIYMEHLFKNKSIYGTEGFKNMFWSLMDSIPGSSKFRISTINNITEEMFSYFAGQFFGDPQYGIGMTKARLRDLMVHGKNSIFAQLNLVKSKKFKYYEELKDNLVLNSITIDSKEGMGLENYLVNAFKTHADGLALDDYIEDMNVLINHEDRDVQLLGRQLYLYSFYSTGFRHRAYDYLKYMSTATSKQVQMVNGETKAKNLVSFNEFVKKMLVDLNDPAGIVEHFERLRTEVLKHSVGLRHIVPNIDYLITNENKNYDKGKNLVYIEVPSEDAGDLLLGANEDGSLIYANYVSVTDAVRYNSPYTIPTSEMETMKAKEDKTIGSELGLFEFIGINLANRNPIYRPVNKKGMKSLGVVAMEYGINSDTSFIESNNLVKQRTLEETIELVRNDINSFKHIPMEKLGIVVKSASQNSDMNTNYAHLMMEADAEEARLRGAKPVNREWRVSTIISGIQTGIDTIGIAIAKLLGYKTGGYTTHNYGGEFTQNEPDTSPINSKRKKFALEHGVAAVTAKEINEFLEDIAMDKYYKDKADNRYYLVRTYMNVKNSDATVYFPADLEGSGGLKATRNAARRYDKRFFIYVSKEQKEGWKNDHPEQIVFSSVEELRYLLKKYDVETLNIAGSRGSRLSKGQVSFYTAFMEEALKPETPAVIEEFKETEVKKELANTKPGSISTANNKLKIFIDGSVVPGKEGPTNYGYGAYTEFGGNVYEISGTKEDVDTDELFKLHPELKDQQQFSPSIELFGLIKTLEHFKDTSEHIQIYTDSKVVINSGELWNRAKANDPERYSKPTKSKSKHIVYLTNRAVNLIKSIEKAGGSVTLTHVESHMSNSTDISNFITKNNKFGLELDPSFVRWIKEGNDLADQLAKHTERTNTFGKLTGKIEPIGTPILKSKEVFNYAEDDQKKDKEATDFCSKPAQ